LHEPVSSALLCALTGLVLVDRSIAVHQPCGTCSLVGISLVPSAIDARLGMIAVALAGRYIFSYRSAYRMILWSVCVCENTGEHALSRAVIFMEYDEEVAGRRQLYGHVTCLRRSHMREGKRLKTSIRRVSRQPLLACNLHRVPAPFWHHITIRDRASYPSRTRDLL